MSHGIFAFGEKLGSNKSLMFTFNRNEQIVILMLSAALLVGMVVSYLDKTNSDLVPDFDVKKGAIPVPEMQDTISAPHSPAMIDINTATAKDFEKLSGIGPQIAQRIVEHRTKAGGFTQIEDLTNVSGIGPKTLEKIRTQLVLTQP
jgi:comEA protein